MRILLLVTVIFVSAGVAQKSKPDIRLEKRGTCAVTATAPFGAAFVIDSRVTALNAEGQILYQTPGCKVLLARPTILLAGVGLEDTTGRAGHWNSLDAASEELKRLPDNPTVEQLDSWSFAWGNTLIQHFRAGGEVPRAIGEVADILLLTKVGQRYYYRRASVEWNGKTFDRYMYGRPVNPYVPNVQYAGACRAFFTVDDGKGNRLSAQYSKTLAETRSANYWGTIKDDAKSVDDLVDAVRGLESLSTDIDMRLEGVRAVIAPPYATAKWGEGEQGWTAELNSECHPNAKR